jgi:diacylglycerol kinase (ATP)
MFKWFDSASCAIEGILQAARSQKHLRYHFIAAFLVLVAVFILGVSRTDFLIVALAVVLVLLAEMLNTAVENVVDMLSPGHSEKARIAKDTAAGAVFITAFGAAVMGIIVLYPYLQNAFTSGLSVAKHSAQDVIILALVLVLIAVVLMKARFGRGHPLSGGMPSGHSALAFSAWVCVSYITDNFFASALTFILAFSVAKSRVSKGVHRPVEAAAGAVIGAAITFIIFKLFF